MRMWSRVLFPVFLVTATFASCLGLDPIVTISQGEVRGSWSADGSYAQFFGIPFASVDQNNPFGASLPAPQFNGTFEANNDNVFCPQVDMFTNTLHDTLDCLTVNVYVPKSASPSNLMPVMVYIFGGRFQQGSSGSSDLGPEYLLAHDVILVTVNYRVNVYGFMCLDIPSVPGNNGLKDQRNGMRWVKKNIKDFGGDESKITVFGQSAGGMSVEFHLLTPGSAGLFKRAILQSGSALVEETVVISRPSTPIELAAAFNHTSHSTEDALNFIKTIAPSKLVLAAFKSGIDFKPCIEKSFTGVESLITEYPNRILESGNYEKVPIIIGYNDAEQSMLYKSPTKEFFEGLKDLFKKHMNGYFKFQSEKELNSVAEIVKQFYIGTEPMNNDTAQSLEMFETDAHFVIPIERSIKYRLSTSNSPIYQYMFTYTSDSEKSVFGASHGAEMNYIFGGIDNVNSSKGSLLRDRMTTMWTNFAKYGNPTPSKSTTVNVRWPMVTEKREYLNIDEELTIKRKPRHQSVALWDMLFQAYGEYFRAAWPSTRKSHV